MLPYVSSEHPEVRPGDIETLAVDKLLGDRLQERHCHVGQPRVRAEGALASYTAGPTEVPLVLPVNYRPRFGQNLGRRGGRPRESIKPHSGGGCNPQLLFSSLISPPPRDIKYDSSRTGSSAGRSFALPSAPSVPAAAIQPICKSSCFIITRMLPRFHFKRLLVQL
jgi:hypothetical protein